MATRKHGVRSREKGRKYEQKIVQKLRAAGFVSAARNLSQSRTAKAEGPDIVGVHGVWLELCHAKNADPKRKHAQAVTDSAGDGRRPVVVWRRDGFLKDQVTVSIADLDALLLRLPQDLLRLPQDLLLVTMDLDDFLAALRRERGL
jgi:hypothetical protein